MSAVGNDLHVREEWQAVKDTLKIRNNRGILLLKLQWRRCRSPATNRTCWGLTTRRTVACDCVPLLPHIRRAKALVSLMWLLFDGIARHVTWSCVSLVRCICSRNCRSLLLLLLSSCLSTNEAPLWIFREEASKKNLQFHRSSPKKTENKKLIHSTYFLAKFKFFGRQL